MMGSASSTAIASRVCISSSAGNTGQQIVEIMRQPIGELADRLHLLIGREKISHFAKPDLYVNPDP